MTCDKCGEELIVGDWPWCPHGSGTNNVIQDSIEGGIMIKHGICNEDGTPKRYDSKKAIRDAAASKGLMIHDGIPDAKPNPHRVYVFSK